MHVCVYKFLVGVQANIENIFENLSKIVKTFLAKEIFKKTSKSICSGVMNHDLLLAVADRYTPIFPDKHISYQNVHYIVLSQLFNL